MLADVSLRTQVLDWAAAAQGGAEIEDRPLRRACRRGHRQQRAEDRSAERQAAGAHAAVRLWGQGRGLNGSHLAGGLLFFVATRRQGREAAWGKPSPYFWGLFGACPLGTPMQNGEIGGTIARLDIPFEARP